MADNAGLSAALDGIPMVADAAARDARFPLSTRKQNQRVFRLDTGVQERWSGSVWVRDTAQVFDVRRYGAVGDGTADDTTAFLAAIAAAVRAAPVSGRETNATGSILLIPPGDYLITGALTLPIGVNVIGCGARVSRLIVTMPNATTDLFTWTAPVSGYADGSRFIGFEVISTGYAASRDAFNLAAPGWVRVQDVRVYGFGRYGFNLQDTIFTRLDEVQADACQTNGLLVSGTAPSTTLTVIGGAFRNTPSGFGASVDCIGARFVGTTFESNGASDSTKGGLLVAGRTCDAIGCYFENNAGANVEVGVSGGSSPAPTVTITNPVNIGGANFTVGASYGVRVRAATNVQIIGGDFSSYTKTIVADSVALANVTSIVGALTYPNNPTVTGGAITDYALVTGKDADGKAYVRTRVASASERVDVAGTQVVGPRATGWTAGTGTPNKGAFAADTATAVQAAQRVLALEQALRTHGLIV